MARDFVGEQIRSRVEGRYLNNSLHSYLYIKIDCPCLMLLNGQLSFKLNDIGVAACDAAVADSVCAV